MENEDPCLKSQIQEFLLIERRNVVAHFTLYQLLRAIDKTVTFFLLNFSIRGVLELIKIESLFSIIDAEFRHQFWTCNISSQNRYYSL